MPVSSKPACLTNKDLVLSQTRFGHKSIELAGHNELFEIGLKGGQLSNPGSYGLFNARGLRKMESAGYGPVDTDVFSEKQFWRVNLNSDLPRKLSPSRSAQIYKINLVKMIKGRVEMRVVVVFDSNVLVKGLFKKFDVFAVLRLFEYALLIPYLEDRFILVPEVQIAYHYNNIS